MSITFTAKQEHGYFISKYVGRLTDEDLIQAWKDFFERGEWIPCLNELADLSELDSRGITSQGIERLAEYAAPILKKHCKSAVKVAVYSPKDLSYGLSRMYEAMSDESTQKIYVFRERAKAELWLMEK